MRNRQKIALTAAAIISSTVVLVGILFLSIFIIDLDVSPRENRLVDVDFRLLDAVREDTPDLQRIQSLLRSDPELISKEVPGYGHVLLWADHGNVDLIKLLLEAGASPTHRAEQGLLANQSGLTTAIVRMQNESLRLQLAAIDGKLPCELVKELRHQAYRSGNSEARDLLRLMECD